MARVKVGAARTAGKAIRKIALSAEMSSRIRPLAWAVLEAASSDPNERYVALLVMEEHRSRGPLGRVSWRVGCEVPELGRRVEAERGTLARAMGGAGV